MIQKQNFASLPLLSEGQAAKRLIQPWDGRQNRNSR